MASPRLLIPAPTSYRVKSGDSLWRIARRFDLKSQDIADWNTITLDSVLQPGQLLTLNSSSYVLANDEEQRILSYSVIRGDSLDRIARKFNVTLEDLVLWNNLDPSGLIFPGQKLLIHIPDIGLN